jgi:hypothetical protein
VLLLQQARLVAREQLGLGLFEELGLGGRVQVALHSVLLCLEAVLGLGHVVGARVLEARERKERRRARNGEVGRMVGSTFFKPFI